MMRAMIKFSTLASILFAVILAQRCSAQEQPPIVLFPGGAPGALGTADKDIPTITPFLPDPSLATGTAIVVCPGGGYQRLAPKEGKDYALFLNRLGIAAF